MKVLQRGDGDTSIAMGKVTGVVTFLMPIVLSILKRHFEIVLSLDQQVALVTMLTGLGMFYIRRAQGSRPKQAGSLPRNAPPPAAVDL